MPPKQQCDHCPLGSPHHTISLSLAIPLLARHEATKLELERVNGVFELSVEFVPYSQSTSKNGTSGPFSSLFALELVEDMMVRVAIVDHPN